MPLYEFRCDKCSRGFEELIRSAADNAAVRCPRCRSRNVTREMSLFGVGAGSRSSPRHGGGCASCASGKCGSCGRH